MKLDTTDDHRLTYDEFPINDLEDVVLSSSSAATLPGPIREPADPPPNAERPAAPAKRAPRLYVLDGLRLVAASTVVAAHWIGAGTLQIGTKKAQAWGRPPTRVFDPTLHHVAAYGWLGVELFFLISGFVICMSSWGRGVSAFARSRCVRLFPGYWAAVLLTAAVLVALPSLAKVQRPGLFGDVLTNLTMIHNSYGVQSIDPVYWTLARELMFYILFAAAVVAFGVTYRRVVLFCVGWSIGAVAASATHNDLLSFAAQPDVAPYFIAGIGFYLIYRFGPTLLLYGIVGFSFLIAQHQVRDTAAIEGSSMHIPHYAVWPAQAALFGFFALMALVAHHKLDFVRWRGLVALGALTYPLYLLHQAIGFSLIATFRGTVPAIPLVIALFAVMLALSWLFQRYIERPGGRLLGTQLDRSFESIRLASR